MIVVVNRHWRQLGVDGRNRSAYKPIHQIENRNMLSQRAKYALKALCQLARHPEGQLMLVSEIAEREQAPRKFLELILLDLKRHGLVFSQRGKNGGYALAKSPAAITVGEVIRILDETVDWYRMLGVQQQSATQPSDLLILYANRQVSGVLEEHAAVAPDDRPQARALHELSR